MDNGRPLGMSTESATRWRDERCSLSLDEWREELLLLDLDDDLEDEEDVLDDEVLDDDLDDDLDEDLEDDLCESVGTSRMFSSRPVVGSTVEVTLGLWAMW